MPMGIDWLSAWGTPTRAGYSARYTGISMLERNEWTLQSPLYRPPFEATAWDSSCRVSRLAIVALQQQLPASQQAITARLVYVQVSKARSHLQQHQQAQPAHHPQQAALKLAGGTAQSIASATRDAKEQAAVTAGVNTNAKQRLTTGWPMKGPSCSLPAAALTYWRR